MGGDITVESVFGEGTTFTVTLPADVGAAVQGAGGEQAPRITYDESIAVAAGGGDNQLVVVIDDDAGARELMARYLTREGFQVATASNGDDGIKLVRELKPAAITLDVMMPDLDGWGVLDQIKTDPELAHIPVVMCTIVDSQARGYALGATDYLTKPVDRQRPSLAPARRRPRAPSSSTTILPPASCWFERSRTPASRSSRPRTDASPSIGSPRPRRKSSCSTS